MRCIKGLTSNLKGMRDTRVPRRLPLPPAHAVHLQYLLAHCTLRRYQFVRSWTPLRTAEQIVCVLHVQASQDRGRDEDCLLTEFVHEGRIIFRLLFATSSSRSRRSGEFSTSLV